jgi:ABC-2 type transport system permease protein
MNMTRLVTVSRREIQRFLRIPIQTLVSPWISATLYILVFGVIVGSRISFLEGIDYIDFVLPGILMLQLVNGALGQSSTSLYFQRWTHVIDEMLTSPLSYAEMIFGYIIGGVSRALAVGFGIYVIALLFTDATPAHIPAFLFYVVIISIIFSLFGLLIGLWAEKFEHLNVFQTFIITPLIYVGGVFNSIDMLPETIRPLARLNPFFYMVDGLRYSMISFSESPLLAGAIGLCVIAVFLFVLVWVLFHRGWKLRS